jgi:hypothetical protein
MKKSFAPTLAKEMQNIQSTSVINAYGEDPKDGQQFSRFLVLPRDVSDFSWFTNDDGEYAGFQWKDVGNEDETRWFNKAIPKTPELKCEVLPLRLLLVGDLKWLMTVSGRENHSHNKCYWCKSKKGLWDDQSTTFEAWTDEELRATKKKRDEDQAKSKDPQANDHIFGVQQNPIFPIKVEETLPPGLHLQLGTPKAVMDNFSKSVQKLLEELPAAEKLIYQELTTAISVFEAAEMELSDFERDDLTQLKRNENEISRHAERSQEGFGAATNISRKVEATKVLRATYDSLKQQLDAAEKRFVAAAKVEAGTTFTKGPVHLAIERVLLSKGIRRQAYFGGTFIGPHVKILLQLSGDIMREICEAVIEVLKEVEKDDAVRMKKIEDIKKLTEDTAKILGVLDVVCSGMRSTIPLTSAERKTFRHSCKMVGILWREMYGKETVFPKLHVLETHVPDFMDRFWILGVFSEDLIEKEHHVDRILLEAYASVKDFKVKHTGMESKIALTMAPKVAKFRDGISSTRKRKVQKVSNSEEKGVYKKRKKTIIKDEKREEQKATAIELVELTVNK